MDVKNAGKIFGVKQNQKFAPLQSIQSQTEFDESQMVNQTILRSSRNKSIQNKFKDSNYLHKSSNLFE